MKGTLRASVGLVLVVATLGATASAQTPSTGRVMRDKLVHAQNILIAIGLTSKWDTGSK